MARKPRIVVKDPITASRTHATLPDEI